MMISFFSVFSKLRLKKKSMFYDNGPNIKNAESNRSLVMTFYTILTVKAYIKFK